MAVITTDNMGNESAMAISSAGSQGRRTERSIATRVYVVWGWWLRELMSLLLHAGAPNLISLTPSGSLSSQM